MDSSPVPEYRYRIKLNIRDIIITLEYVSEWRIINYEKHYPVNRRKELQRC